MTESERRRLAKRIVHITMADSGEKKAPTVLIRDFGVGVHPDDFAGTLLSIHGQNKRGKPHLHGRFGHGAATTLRYAECTVIISRPVPAALRSRDDLVGLTLVRFRPPSEDEEEGVYEYLTDEEGQVPRAQPDGLPDGFPCGTHVAHVRYDLPGYSASFTRQRSGLWALVNSQLFDPALPALMRGERDEDRASDRSGSGRIAAGNAALLAARPHEGTPHASAADGAVVLLHDTFEIALDRDSAVDGELWVLDKSKSAETYVTADQQLTVTRHGQRHAARSRQWFRSLKMSYLSQHMVVHLSADRLSYPHYRDSFSSLRDDDVRGGFLDEVVLGRVASYLRSHDGLLELEDRLREEDLARSADRASDRLRRTLAKRMDRALRGRGMPGQGVDGDGRASGRGRRGAGQEGTEGWGRKRRSGRGGTPKPDPDDTHLPTVPTALVAYNSPRTVRQGASCHLGIELDAKNGYLPTHSRDLHVDVRSPRGQATAAVTYMGCSRLLGGRGRLVFQAAASAEPGAYEIGLRLVTADGVLSATGKVEVLPARHSRSPTASSTRGLPDITWVSHAEGWPAEWDVDEVGDAQVSGDALTIRLSKDFAPLSDARRRKPSRQAVQSLEGRYLVSVAFGLWMQNTFNDEHRDADPVTLKAARQQMAQVALQALDLDEGEDDEG